MADLTDLEITKLCAEASEAWKHAHEWFPTMTLDSTFVGVEIRGDKCVLVPRNPFRQDPRIYDPLHDDAQAMALVKKMELWIQRTNTSYWQVTGLDSGGFLFNADLNRAICECVARMQLEKNRA